jgi:hypothetical protein
MGNELIPSKNSPDFFIKQRQTKILSVEVPLEAHIQIQQMKLDFQKGSIKEVVTDALNEHFKRHGYIPLA